MKLRWHALALADRTAIFDYLMQNSPRAAVLLDERIEYQIEILQGFPHLGRPGRIAGTRELLVAGTSYIVAYAVEDETIRLLRVLHSSQLWPEELP